MIDTTTEYLGLTLAHPVVASSSPLTGDPDSLLVLEEAGAAAVVLPSLFEEQIEHDALAFGHDLVHGGGVTAEADDGWFPTLDHYDTHADHALALLRTAVASLRIPVIASLNGTTAGGWTHYAQALADEGAAALELNIHHVPTSLEESSADVERRYLDLVAAVRAEVELPLAVKIGPFFSAPADMARRLVDAGADALVLFNRFHEPDIDLDRRTVVPELSLSDGHEIRLALRWIGILAGRLDVDLAATSGVWTPEHAVKLILAGADVVMCTSALLRHGPSRIGEIADGVGAWFAAHGHESIGSARGSLSQASASTPGAYERANYLRLVATTLPT